MPAPPIGLDITSTSMTVVVLKKQGRDYVVAQSVVAPLDHGIVVDGEVNDVERLANSLREVWSTEKIKGTSVCVGLANQRCITRMIDLPRIRQKRALHDAVLFEVGDHLPIPLEEAVVDFHTVQTYDDETTGVTRQRHIAVAAYRETVERFRDAVEGAGLKLVRIDLAAFAMMRSGLADVDSFPAISQQPEGVEVSLAMCDVGPTGTNVAVVRNGICELNRVVSFGTDGFTQALVENFGWGKEDADRVRFEAGVMPLGGVESPGDPYSDTRRVMQFATEQLAHELQTTFQFYTHSTDGAVPIVHVVLSGEGALLRGIEQKLASELGIPISILDASVRLRSDSLESLGASHAHLGVALGLAMEEAA